MVDNFTLPASNFAFGIAVPEYTTMYYRGILTSSTVLLFGFINASFHADHYQVPQSTIPNVGSTFSVGNDSLVNDQGLTLLRFHISKSFH